MTSYYYVLMLATLFIFGIMYGTLDYYVETIQGMAEDPADWNVPNAGIIGSAWDALPIAVLFAVMYFGLTNAQRRTAT